MDRAAPMLQRALEGLEATLGPEAGEVADVAVDLGALHLDQGRDGVGLPLLKRALAIQTALLGSDHAEVIAIREVVEC